MKKALLTAMIFCMVFAFAACGSNSAKGGDGVMDVSIASEPDSIDPALSTSLDGGTMNLHTFEGLVKWADDGKGHAKLVPGMAESWDVSDDQLEWTFHLRKGLKWSDGSPLTAKDFVYAWNRLVKPETGADYEYMLDMVSGYDSEDKVLDIEAPDDQTFKVKLAKLTPYFEEICAFPATSPVKQEIIEKNGDKWTNSPDTYVSNGPFKMTERKRNSKIVMEPNENYYDKDKVKTKKLVFHLMDDTNAMYAAFKSGELDFINQVPPDEVKALLKDKTLKVDPQIGTYFVCFNNKKAPFDNPKVREAFSLVIDRNFIVSEVAGTGEIPAGAYVPKGINDAKGVNGDDFRKVGGDYYSVDKKDYDANCEKAKNLMAEAGYPDGQGFPSVDYLYNTDANHKAIAEALQNMWQEKLGVTVNLQNQEWNVFLNDRKQGNYLIARHGWVGDYNDPMTFLDMFITGGGNNDAKYENPAYDALIQTAKAEKDPEKRMKTLHDAEKMLVADDNVVAPLYFYTSKRMIQDGEKGLYYTPLGYYFFGNMTGI
ncbi:MAG: peptide ABC transporter substrate-binding protein [Clostridiales bacterium]|nr:peptide ABC transporter substrate-binding protein [Clostridiales bacterium]